MPVNLSVFDNFNQISGVRLGVAQSAVRYPDRDDMVIFELAENSQVAGVFTSNAFCAAPVQICRLHLEQASPRYLLINTGNANAGTGPEGYQDAIESCRLLAQETGVKPEQILPFSTGVIGEPLNMAAFQRGIPSALENLSSDNWSRAGQGILTTDTLPKGDSQQLDIAGHSISISGLSKGAGMIMPNMATMLAFVATDAAIAPELMQTWVKQLADASFNRITVDGDTSTNDACMLIATGQSDLRIDSADSPEAKSLFAALKSVFIRLAQAIVRDAEGATKFVTIQVTGAETKREALDTAYTVAHSPLVKTAMYASDANWGRILAAVGRAGIENLALDQIQIHLNDVQIVLNGGRNPSYKEELGAAVFAEQEFTVRIELGRGSAEETIWTSDLSHEYVSINADYRS